MFKNSQIWPCSARFNLLYLIFLLTFCVVFQISLLQFSRQEEFARAEWLSLSKQERLVLDFQSPHNRSEMYLSFGSDISIMDCPFCKVPMVKGYLSLLGDGSALYFSEEKISYTTGRGKKKEVVLEGGAFGLAWEEDYSRTAYKCNDCNAVILKGKPKPAYIDAVRAAQAENEKENLKDRTRQLSRF